MDELDAHDNFTAKMAVKFPRYFGEGKRYGGFAIGAGWYPIIEELVGQIDHYTKWKRNNRAYDLRIERARKKGYDAVLAFITKKSNRVNDWDRERAEEIMEDGRDITPKVNWIEIQQIKEKFGGLRFYYDGGDERISGMETMAEIWAGRTCETCGNKGERRSGGWVRTLCDFHENLYQTRKQND